MISDDLFTRLGRILNPNYRTTSKDVVNSYVKELQKRFFNIEIAYIFEKSDDTHIISIESCEDVDIEDIVKYESWAYADFFEKYPYELIIFTYPSYIKFT